jgi:hypothetical protein
MSDYTLQSDPTFYWLICTRDPVSDETGQLTPGIDYVANTIFWVKNGNKVWCCIDSSDVSALVFKEVSAIGKAPDGWLLNSERSYSARSTPAFDTTYTPSVINDTFVIFSFTQASAALGSATLTLLIDGATVDVRSCSGLVTNRQDSFSFICPKNKTYRVNSSTSGVGSSNTIGTVSELTL